MVPVWRFTRGGSGTWCQYRVQARDEVGGRAGVLHRLRGIPNVRGGRDGVSVRDIKGCGADRGHGDSTVCCIGYVEPPCGCQGAGGCSRDGVVAV